MAKRKGDPKPMDPPDDDETNPKVRFSPPRRERFLAQLSDHGQPTLAAHSAGVRPEDVDAYMADHDPGGEFKKSSEWALKVYSAWVVRNLERDAIDGHVETLVDKNGSKVGERIKLETALRVRILERHDPRYSQRVDVTTPTDGDSGPTTGVLLVPAVQVAAGWAEHVKKVKGES